MKEPFGNLLERAWIDLQSPQVAWQIAVLLFCVALAWAAGRALRLSRVEADGIWKFGVGGLRRILFPAVALIPLMVSIGLVNRWIEVDLLRLFVVVRAGDGREAIIPNELLITTTVLNHSYSNRQVRLAIQVQVGYQGDPERAMRLMEKVASTHPRVLADPPPKAFLARFGDSGIELELGVWIGDPEIGMLNIRSELNLEVWRAFQEAGIEIPYPQREVRVLPGASGVSG